MELPKLFYWIDDSVGLGHKMQGQAILEAWQERGGNGSFTGTPTKLSVIVFDGYQWEDRARKLWKDAGHFVVTIHDVIGKYTCNLLIDKNYRAEYKSYAAASTTRMLLGVDYFPLRDIYKTLDPTEEVDVFDADSVSRALLPNDFARQMARAKVVVCSAGLTVYEALYLQKPIILRCATGNQRWTYDHLLADGLAIPADSYGPIFFLDDNVLRSRQRESLAGLIDGHGAERIVVAITTSLARRNA